MPRAGAPYRGAGRTVRVANVRHSREPGRTGLRGRLAASDRTNLIRVMPAKGGAGRPCRPQEVPVAPVRRTSSSSGRDHRSGHGVAGRAARARHGRGGPRTGRRGRPGGGRHAGRRHGTALRRADAARAEPRVGPPLPEFAAELADATGQDLGYRRCGTLAVALDADDRAHLRELHAFQTQCGLESEWLSGRECRRLEPMLAPGVRGGLRVDGDHQIDPADSPARWSPPANGPGWPCTGCARSASRSTATGPRGSSPRTAHGSPRDGPCWPRAASAGGWPASRTTSCRRYGP